MAHRTFETLTAALADLHERGFTEDFEYETKFLRLQRTATNYPASDLNIVEVYRFEGMSDPDDNSVLYAIENTAGDVKGVIIDGYGASASAEKSLFLQTIPTARTDD
jgi:hypothetical protein